jgi:hypothetical protein
MKKPFEILMDEFGIGETRANEIADKLLPAFREETHTINGRELLARRPDLIPNDLDVNTLSGNHIAYLDIIFQDILVDDADGSSVEAQAIREWLESLKEEGYFG